MVHIKALKQESILFAYHTIFISLQVCNIKDNGTLYYPSSLNVKSRSVDQSPLKISFLQMREYMVHRYVLILFHLNHFNVQHMLQLFSKAHIHEWKN